MILEKGLVDFVHYISYLYLKVVGSWIPIVLQIAALDIFVA